MFAVKGWSIKAEKPKAESASAPAIPSESKFKKRKRASAAPEAENVTFSNVADLWERVIEQKEPRSEDGMSKRQQKREKKRQKLDANGPLAEVPGVHEVKKDKSSKSDDKLAKKEKKGKDKTEPVQKSSVPEDKPAKKEKKKKDKREKRSDQGEDAPEKPEAKQAAEPKPSPAATKPAAPASKLTPLQASMREKLISARFRHLNETLYTRPSADAYQLFEESPEMFMEYHEGFRRQVDVWPENPVDGYIQDIKTRARQKFQPRDNRKAGASDTSSVQPLPRNRNTGTCTIADLGCGDARLSSTLQPIKEKLKLEILSFDLHSPAPFVTKADIANIPMASGTVDVAIFCLALMGTNWIDFVEEAYRILRWKGELWVAEIKSRFGHVGSGAGKKGGVVEHSVGNRRNPGAAGGGGAAAAAGVKKKGPKGGKDADLNEKELAVEVDGEEDTRQQTDVSAFVAALQRRGFVLHGEASEAAVDLSNRMFVKLRFLKAAPAVRGKNVQKEQKERPGLGPSGPPKKPKFIDAEEEKEVNEAAILKPCVYKLR